jgi:hypothetical protein
VSLTTLSQDGLYPRDCQRRVVRGCVLAQRQHRQRSNPHARRFTDARGEVGWRPGSWPPSRPTKSRWDVHVFRATALRKHCQCPVYVFRAMPSTRPVARLQATDSTRHATGRPSTRKFVPRAWLSTQPCGFPVLVPRGSHFKPLPEKMLWRSAMANSRTLDQRSYNNPYTTNPRLLQDQVVPEQEISRKDSASTWPRWGLERGGRLVLARGRPMGDRAADRRDPAASPRMCSGMQADNPGKCRVPAEVVDDLQV